MIFTIPVTAAHIAKGKPQEACDCPVWHAIAEALPWLAAPDLALTVGPASVSFITDDDDAPYGVAHIELPARARDFICEFDQGGHVPPFEFTLDVPDHLVPAGAVPAGGEH